MIEDRDKRYLAYVLESIDLILERTSMGYQQFSQDRDVQDAVLWRLQTLAEATGKLSKDLKDRYPEIRWRAIYGFRNIAAHAYLDLNLDLVWEIAHEHLSGLRDVAVQELG